MNKSNKRVAIVTGCGKSDGLGAATARALVKGGVAVAVCDISAAGLQNAPETARHEKQPADGLAALVTELRASGGDVEPIIGDVAVEKDVTAMVHATVDRFGRLDILVNNAGAPHGEEFNEITDIPVSAWDQVMRVNAFGTFLMMRACVPHMRSGKWGRIVNISSVLGKMGMPRHTIYAASKAAVIQMTRCLAAELGPYGINVNAVCPGRMLTSRAISDIIRKLGADKVDADIARRAADQPIRRVAKAAEVAEVVAFLCSDGASYTTGQAISVDGGLYPI